MEKQPPMLSRCKKCGITKCVSEGVTTFHPDHSLKNPNLQLTPWTEVMAWVKVCRHAKQGFLKHEHCINEQQVLTEQETVQNDWMLPPEWSDINNMMGKH